MSKLLFKTLDFGELIKKSNTTKVMFKGDEVWAASSGGDDSGDTDTLPSGYTALEYIINSTAACIDTGIYCQGNTNIKVTFQDVKVDYQWPRIVAGGFENKNFTNIEYTNNALRYCFMQTTAQGISTGLSMPSTKTTLEISNTGLIVYDEDGTSVIGTYSIVTVSEDKAADTNFPIILLTNTRNDTYSSVQNGSAEAAQGYLYGCTIKNGTETVCNLVPCQNADGEVGMYDTVQKVFRGSAATAYSFEAGPVKA